MRLVPASNSGKGERKAGRFGKVPGDDADFIPLSEESPPPVDRR
jgi:hypothetical protein